VFRPTFLDFEDGNGAIFPTHIIGIMADGKVSTGGGDLNYMLAVGNGSSINTDSSPGNTEIDVHNVTDTQDKKMVVGAINYKMSSVPLQFGVFALHDPFAESGAGTYSGVATNGDLIGMQVWGADVHYASHGFDMIAESYNITNKDKSPTNAGSNDASAYYVQFGYRVTDKFKPIYRYESVDYQRADPYFRYLATPEGGRHVLAMRYDLDDTNALKFEVSRFEPVQTGVKSYTAYALQWAFLML